MVGPQVTTRRKLLPQEHDRNRTDPVRLVPPAAAVGVPHAVPHWPACGPGSTTTTSPGRRMLVSRWSNSAILVP